MSEVAAANAVRVQRITAAGVNVPLDTMYAASLLEFLLADRLVEAREYHENRIAPILLSAEANIAVFQEQMREAGENQAEAQRTAEVRSRLLGHN